MQSSSWEARVGLLLVPIAATILVGGYFLGRGKFNLFLIVLCLMQASFKIFFGSKIFLELFLNYLNFSKTFFQD